MRTLIAVMILGAAVAALPALSASTSYGSEYGLLMDGTPQAFEAAIGPRSLTLTLQTLALTGDATSDVRSYIDQQFNDQTPDAPDGIVTKTEAETAEIALQSTLNEAVQREIDFQAIRIDGFGATSVYVSDLDIYGAEGATDSTSDITSDISVTLIFKDVDTSLAQHHVVLENIYADVDLSGTGEDYPVTLTLRAINEWAIVGPSIEPAAAAEHFADGKFSFTNEEAALFDEQGEALAFDIQGDPDVIDEEPEKGFLPAPAFLGAIAALGVAARLGRRRQ